MVIVRARPWPDLDTMKARPTMRDLTSTDIDTARVIPGVVVLVIVG